MRLIYLDPGLNRNLGHHANSCRQIARAVKERGWQLTVLAYGGIEGELKAELGALPFFRWGTYASPSLMTDPVAGLLRDFELGTEATVGDLKRIGGLLPGDIVYLNSGQAVQYAAMIRWLKELPKPGRPAVAILEFGMDPGVTVSIVDGQRRYDLADLRARLYRFASYAWPAEEPLPLHCVTFDQGSSDAYAWLLRHPVVTVPLVRLAITDRRSRVGADPITIGVLGHQRRDKGYQLVPDIVGAVWAARPRTKFLVHNAAPSQMPVVEERLRGLAQADGRLALDHRIADQTVWAGLLARCDLILCPYEANRFRTSHSAIMSEAVAEAIPTVVPADTSLSALANAFGSPCTTFEFWTADSVAAAVIEAIDRFDEIARRAEAAALRWPLANGPGRFLDAIAAMATAPNAEIRAEGAA